MTTCFFRIVCYNYNSPIVEISESDRHGNSEKARLEVLLESRVVDIRYRHRHY